jgi:hypothetical protein
MNPLAIDLEFSVETSTDLGFSEAWSLLALDELEEILANPPWVKLPVTLDGSRRFFRVSVSQEVSTTMALQSE